MIGQPVELEKEEDSEDELIRNVTKLTKVIEKMIRQYPDQWGGWMHKRWKSRTIEEQTVIDRMNEEAARKKQGVCCDSMQ